MPIRRKITRSLHYSDVQNGQRGEIFKFVTNLGNKLVVKI